MDFPLEIKPIYKAGRGEGCVPAQSPTLPAPSVAVSPRAPVNAPGRAARQPKDEKISAAARRCFFSFMPPEVHLTLVNARGRPGSGGGEARTCMLSWTPSLHLGRRAGSPGVSAPYAGTLPSGCRAPAGRGWDKEVLFGSCQPCFLVVFVLFLRFP